MQEYFEFIQQNVILAVAWAGLAVALIMNFVKTANAAYKEISTAEATQLINREDGVVVDIRSKDEYKKGRITDAINVQPSEIKSGELAALENHKNVPIIVVCKTGQTAPESANLLAQAGFEKVYVLKNGLISWEEAKMPLITGKKKK